MKKHFRLPAAVLAAALVVNSCAALILAEDEDLGQVEQTVTEEQAEEQAEEPVEEKAEVQAGEPDVAVTVEETADEAAAAEVTVAGEAVAEAAVAKTALSEEAVPADNEASESSEVKTYLDSSDSNAYVGYETGSTSAGAGELANKKGIRILGGENGNLKHTDLGAGFVSFIRGSAGRRACEFDTVTDFGDLSVDVRATLKNHYVLLTYTVTNNGSSAQNISIGALCELALDGNASIPVTKSGGNIIAYNDAKAIALAVVPDSEVFDTKWVGAGSSAFSQYVFGFAESSDESINTGSGSLAAGLTYSFSGEVPANGTWVRKVRFYAGDLDLYKITYNKNGGEGSMDDQIFFPDVPTTLRANTFTKADHKFKGWSKSSSATSATYKNEEAVIGFTGDTTLYAVWQENPIPTITADDVELTYGDAGGSVTAATTGDGALTFEVSSGDNVISVDNATGAITILQAGDAKIKISSAATDNYKAASKTINVKVNKKPVDITIDDASKDWGDDDPVFTFVSADAACSFEGTPARAEGEDPGEYKISKGSVQVARGSSTNYTLGKVTKGTFTINEVSVDVTIDYCNGDAPVVVPSSASVPLKVYLERKADSMTYEGRTIVGWYTDANYENEYDSSAPLGRTPVTLFAQWGDVVYEFTKGSKSVWVNDSDEGLEFRASRNVGDDFTFNHFTGVKVDDEDLDSSDFTAKAGSVIVTLEVDFLKDLDVGSHTITLCFDDADDITTSFKVKAAKEDDDDDDDSDDDDADDESAQTGDSASPLILIAAAVLVVAGAVAVFFAIKKRPQKD